MKRSGFSINSQIPSASASELSGSASIPSSVLINSGIAATLLVTGTVYLDISSNEGIPPTKPVVEVVKKQPKIKEVDLFQQKSPKEGKNFR